MQNQQELINSCRYYKGEEEAPNSLAPEQSQFWFYEKCWVDENLDNSSMLNEYEAAIREFNIKPTPGDSTPLTLKAFLLNRYLHWTTYYDHDQVLKDFEVWFKTYYLGRSKA